MASLIKNDDYYYFSIDRLHKILIHSSSFFHEQDLLWNYRSDWTKSTQQTWTTRQVLHTGSLNRVSTHWWVCCHLFAFSSLSWNVPLTSHFSPQLKDQYKGITGFFNVFVKALRYIEHWRQNYCRKLNIFITVFTLFVVYRQGSIIADFVLQTAQFINSELADANEKLTTALNSIAPVIGTVTGSYNSKLSKYCPVIEFNNKIHFLHYELFV